jgi:hypothetical protein
VRHRGSSSRKCLFVSGGRNSERGMIALRVQDPTARHEETQGRRSQELQNGDPVCRRLATGRDGISRLNLMPLLVFSPRAQRVLPGEHPPPRGRSIQAGRLCYINGRAVNVVGRLDASLAPPAHRLCLRALCCCGDPRR